jgi:hypothetical protein
MKRIALFSSALFLLAAGTALGQDVRYNFDKSANFSQFKTYRWVPIKDAAQLDDLRDKQVKETVDAELAKKGLAKTEAENADLYIGYQAGINTEKQYTSYDTGWGYGPGWGGGWYGGGGGMTTGSTSTIYIGQLALDMYDSKTKSIAWRGTPARRSIPRPSPKSSKRT